MLREDEEELELLRQYEGSVSDSGESYNSLDLQPPVTTIDLSSQSSIDDGHRGKKRKLPVYIDDSTDDENDAIDSRIAISVSSGSDGYLSREESEDDIDHFDAEKAHDRLRIDMLRIRGGSCTRCGEQGHDALYCFLCRICGSSHKDSCSKYYCDACLVRGHETSECPYRRMRTDCKECGSSDHITSYCKQFVNNRVVLRPDMEHVPYCYSCGEQGHLGGDCPQFYPRVTSVFERADIPKQCLVSRLTHPPAKRRPVPPPAPAPNAHLRFEANGDVISNSRRNNTPGNSPPSMGKQNKKQKKKQKQQNQPQHHHLRQHQQQNQRNQSGPSRSASIPKPTRSGTMSIGFPSKKQKRNGNQGNGGGNLPKPSSSGTIALSQGGRGQPGSKSRYKGGYSSR